MAEGLQTTSSRYPVIRTKANLPMPGFVLTADSHETASWQPPRTPTVNEVLAQMEGEPGDIVVRTGQGFKCRPLPPELPARSDGVLTCDGDALSWSAPPAATALRVGDSTVDISQGGRPRRGDVLVADSAFRAKWDRLPLPHGFIIKDSGDEIRFPVRSPVVGEDLVAVGPNQLDWVFRRKLPLGGLPGQVLVIGPDMKLQWAFPDHPPPCNHVCPGPPPPTVNTVIQKPAPLPGPFRNDREASMTGKVPFRCPYFRPDGTMVVNQEYHQINQRP